MATIAWDCVPDNVLAGIFSKLDIYDKMTVMNVCTAWQRGGNHPDAWNSVTLKAEDFKDDETDAAFELVLSKLKFCRYLRVDLANKKATGLLKLAKQQCKRLLCLKLSKSLVRFDITTEMFEDLTKDIKSILSQNLSLRELHFDGIILAASVHNEPLLIGLSHARSLVRLHLVNSLDTCSPSPLMYLVNLTELTISPNLLHYKLIKHLTECSLKRLNIITKPKVPEYSEHLTDNQWESLTKESRLNVHVYAMCFLEVGRSYKCSQRILSPMMPLRCLVYNVMMSLPYDSFVNSLDAFSSTLEELVDFSLSVKKGTHKDEVALSLVQKFPRLKTLCLQASYSTSSVLALATLNPRLIHLPIHTGMITLNASDIDLDVHCPELTMENKQFIESNCTSIELFELAMSSLLGQEWRLLTWKEYCDWMRDRYSPLLGELLV